jgi:hypothetical protein
MKIVTGIQALLKLYLRNLKGCNFRIIDARDLLCIWLRCLYVVQYSYQVSWRLVQAFKQYYVSASEILVAVLLVLPMERNYEVHRWDRLFCFHWEPDNPAHKVENLSAVCEPII